jgi:hypothetical protein
VGERLCLRRRATAPVGEQAERAGELAPGPGQLVGEPARPLRVGPRDDERLALETPEPLAEDVRGDARNRLLKLVEAQRPVE